MNAELEDRIDELEANIRELEGQFRDALRQRDAAYEKIDALTEERDVAKQSVNAFQPCDLFEGFAYGAAHEAEGCAITRLWMSRTDEIDKAVEAVRRTMCVVCASS